MAPLVPTNAVSVFAQREALAQAGEAVIAAFRFQRAYGDFPDRLEQLVPEYLSEVPKDPFTGESLRYKREANRLVVYSAGPDRKDDGGREHPPEGPDIPFEVTWPDPAD